MRRFLVPAVALLVGAASSQGCLVFAGAAAGAGGVAYARGNLESHLDASVLEAHRASRQVLQSMELPVLDDQADELAARLRSEFADDHDVRIDIKSKTPNTSEISIRIGIFGDKDRSMRILDEIKNNL